MTQFTRYLSIFTLVVTVCAAVAACGSGDDTGISAGLPREKALKRRSVQTPALDTSVSAPAPTPAPGSPRWQPGLSDTWHLQLNGPLNLNQAVSIYDIDLFDTSAQTIATLRSTGRYVVCYFSAGSSENWRPDFAKFSSSDMGNALSGWAGERWLDTRSDNVRQIMKQRLDVAVGKGCNGVDADNVDGYTNSPGFPLNQTTQLQYNQFLAQEAHARGLAIGLKNDVDQLTQLEPDFDFAVNEQCFQYNECDGYSVFTRNGKPVLEVEYASKYRDNVNGARDALCAASKAGGRRALVLSLQLDASFRFSCD